MNTEPNTEKKKQNQNKIELAVIDKDSGFAPAFHQSAHSVSSDVTCDNQSQVASHRLLPKPSEFSRIHCELIPCVTRD